MCIVIAQPANTPAIPVVNLEQAAKSNPQGMGIAYPKDGRLIIYRDLKNFDKLIKHYQKAIALKASILIHFRVATVGEVHERNCHPLTLDGSSRMVFAHNGTISIPGCSRTKLQGTLSDTVAFKNKVLKPLFASRPDFLDSSHIRELLLKFIDHSKLVFLRADGRLDILGARRGYWDGGVWYSNRSYFNDSSFFDICYEGWIKADDKAKATIEDAIEVPFVQSVPVFSRSIKTSKDADERGSTEIITSEPGGARRPFLFERRKRSKGRIFL